jgi:hypothetical protein
LNGAQQQLQQPHQQEFHSSGQQQQQQQQQHIWVALDAVDGTLKLCGLGNEPGRARVVNDGTWAIGRWVGGLTISLRSCKLSVSYRSCCKSLAWSMMAPWAVGGWG